MANGDLLSTLCPKPEEWRNMEQGLFQEKVGDMFGYLLRRDQKRTITNSISSFVGGIIGGILATCGIKAGF